MKYLFEKISPVTGNKSGIIGLDTSDSVAY